MLKYLEDAAVIAWMQGIETRRTWLNAVLFFSVLPLSLLFLGRYIVPAADEATPRLIAGTIVFSVGIGSVSTLAQIIASDRLNRRLDLYVTAPISPFAYALGYIGFWCARALVSVVVVLLLAPILGITISLSPWLPVIALLTSSSLSGLALVIGTWARDQQSANGLANMAGIVLVFVSPVFFPASNLPEWLQPLAVITPYAYSADAFDAVLSGHGGFVDELGILLAFTIGGLVLGLRAMRWHEV